MRRKIIYKILLRLAIGYLQGVVNLIKLNLENCLEEEIYMKKIFLQMMIVGMMLGVAGCRQKSDAESQINETNQSVEEQTNEMEKEAFILDTELLAELGVLIEEQTFDVTLNDWGKVTFASFAPENSSYQPDGMNPDVRFCLVRNGDVLYEIPGCNEEHTNTDLFLAVSAISFKDYNDDELLDIITICEYESMSGEGFQTAKIYFQLEDMQGFEEDPLLTAYLSEQQCTDSIAAVMSAKEGYWDSFRSENGQSGIYDQLYIIAENKEMWTEELEFANDVYQYAVTDLDRNGRYEVIVSDIGGTGYYTYSRFFEVNEDYDGLVECTTDFVEYDSQPDIISSTLETYIDEKGEFHYAVYDMLKNGAAEYYENVRELILRDGKIITNYIANKSTIYEDATPVITCEDSAGNSLTEQEYEEAAENYFAGYQKTTTSLGWQNVSELKTEVKEIVDQLDMSLNTF